MSKLKVGILGYGVIGRRVADAVRLQEDMEVIGVAGRPNSFSLRAAQLLGYPVFVTQAPAIGDVASRFCNISGSLIDLLEQCDAILDCTPSGVPTKYANACAERRDLVRIVQGGEEHDFAGVSFNSFANYTESAGRNLIRVISCSSTGTTRLVFALNRAYGLREAFVTLVRRGSDPAKRPHNAINALLPVMGQSHHAPDVNTVLPALQLYSMSVDVNTTFGHVIAVQADLERRASREDLMATLASMPRVLVGKGLGTTADLAEHYQELGRRRRDRPEVYVWEEGLHSEGKTVYVTFSVHMESITIPETVDCLRAAFGLARDNWTSIYKTDCALGIAKRAEYYACWRDLSKGASQEKRELPPNAICLTDGNPP
ncbi:MAG: type II glyceraldehyde-3-phosphate dehydrogenase [Verrucomicrobiota bacterium]|jgi:glyceraldehyde-3-phosphate dehydrogenase (NAD(P))